MIRLGLGLIGGLALKIYVFVITQSFFSVLLILFLMGNCWQAFQSARSLRAEEKAAAAGHSRVQPE